MAANVHLRKKATSHSADLGMYRRGTLVEILGEESGSDFPWYHVRIGNVEGYMSSNYVDYYDHLKSVPTDAALSVAQMKGDTALKEKTSGFSKTLAELPAGTVVRVLAQAGGWLHVSVPDDADDWLMRPDERCGYVKSNAVVQATTALALEWMLAD